MCAREIAKFSPGLAANQVLTQGAFAKDYCLPDARRGEHRPQRREGGR